MCCVSVYTYITCQSASRTLLLRLNTQTQEQIELGRVGDGVNQLKQIAVDMNERVRAQNAELNPIADTLTGYKGDMEQVNLRLKAAAKKGKRWGGFGRNVCCMLLLCGQIIALGFLIEFIIRENRKH